MRMMGHITNQKGITLIEVMIAMVILGMGLLSVGVLQTSNMAQNTSSKKSTEGYNWIMDRVERLLIEDYSSSGDLTVGNHTLDSDDSSMISPYTMEWDVESSSTIDNAKEVTVSIEWNGDEVANVNFIRTKTSF
jgi:type IV pilus assembly protein PilV